MQLFRLVNKIYARDLSGKGAALAGGRWNSKGVSVLYTATSPALAVLEQLVRFDIENPPADLVLITIEVPDNVALKEITVASLPKKWCDWHEPKDQAQLTEIGDRWIASRQSLLLRVPSAVTRGLDNNILVNPNLDDSSLLRIVKEASFTYDARLTRFRSDPVKRRAFLSRRKPT